MVIHNFEVVAGRPLEIPKDVNERFKYKVTVHIPPATKAVVCWCESIEHEPMIESLTLKYAMFDTSDYAHGICLIVRRTLHSEVRYLGKFTACVYPIGEVCP